MIAIAQSAADTVAAEMKKLQRDIILTRRAARACNSMRQRRGLFALVEHYEQQLARLQKVTK